MRDSTRDMWQQKVRRAVNLILQTLDDQNKLESLAEEYHSSPSHFHRMFLSLTGESVSGCIRRLRLEKAGMLLKTTDMRILDIALETGYGNADSFTKVFRQQHTLTPSLARKTPHWKWSLYSRAGIHYQQTHEEPWFLIFDKGADIMNVKIVELPPTDYLCLRGTGDYWKMPEVWGRFHGLLMKNSLYHQKAQFASVFFDHTKEELPFSKRSWATSMKAPDTFDEKQIREIGLDCFTSVGGTYAVIDHFGPYEQIGEVWERWRREWLDESEWVLDRDRPSFEWYQNDLSVMPEELLLTLLCDPIIKRQD